MDKTNDSDCVTIGVRLPSTLCALMDNYALDFGLVRSSFLRLFLAWFFSSSSRPYRLKFARFVREYKSFQQL